MFGKTVERDIDVLHEFLSVHTNIAKLPLAIFAMFIHVLKSISKVLPMPQ